MQFKKKIADEFRQNERPDLKGGVVVIFENEVSGWMNELRDPQHWEPGCVAIDENNKMWLAVGGNPYDGAMEWRKIPEARIARK
ncbi:MAG TPA: hypothetical protein DCR95_00110 [Desulfobacter sp.]|uniref:hypothetical protein n=1 Tax=Desulfobacter sp. UBA2225 TaxID=1961413 RepID=UPI000E98C95D|nr:hypothetical protein [Desulfobacter sp. UBA2225]HAR32534.1 hypothetical protein [Desulfobacter sp.]